MTKKGLIAGLIVLALLVYAALAAIALTSQESEALLVCADKGGLKIPFSKALCRQYLLSARGSAQDIEDLHRGIGASFVVQGESTADEREELLKYLVGKGLDVNRIDVHQLTPLHHAVIANEADEVRILLSHGARPDVRDGKFRLTPLELALKLQLEGKSRADTQTVISLLESARP
jgi:hypothetical protein